MRTLAQHVNSVLNKHARVTVESAQLSYESTGKPVKRYHSFQYKAGSWARAERVVAKVEVTSMGTNVRFIVSSLNIRAKVLYEQGYWARGAAELRIKDHKTYLLSGRMSCSSFKANQFRLFFHSAAYLRVNIYSAKRIARGNRVLQSHYENNSTRAGKGSRKSEVHENKSDN